MFTGQPFSRHEALDGLTPEQRVQFIQYAHDLRVQMMKSLWSQLRVWLAGLAERWQSARSYPRSTSF